MIFRSTLHFHSKYPAYTVAEWNFIWNDPCLNLVVIYVLMVDTSNGSWRQGIKGEMTCTVYVAFVWNIIYWIMMIITLFTE